MLMDVEFKNIHVGLDLNSMASVQVGDLGVVRVDLKSGELMNAWLNYDGFACLFNISVAYSNFRPVVPPWVIQSRLGSLRQRFHVYGHLWFHSGEYRDNVEWWSFTSSFSA
ncbi:hypothetical protein NE237_004877 [Protea cynaroides]|uniref:Legume lectin domain-containing protein n=1 Tax=Protea cynaroides TaxID=273540 RepID=A0A9Q0KJF2_9MAGN|nr:hypothetical protein NE237_004877 [Protea cynaroides]